MRHHDAPSRPSPDPNKTSTSRAVRGSGTSTTTAGSRPQATTTDASSALTSRPMRRAYPSVSAPAPSISSRRGSGSSRDLSVVGSSNRGDATRMASIRCGDGYAGARGDSFETAALPLRARVSIGAPSSRSLGLTNNRPPPRLHHEREEEANDELAARAPRRSSFPSTTSTRRCPFARPPEDPSGRLCDASDRPLLCLSVANGEAVVGGADHALYGYEVATGKLKRRLYTKTQGHIDWVSCVSHLEDGRVLSGGGDGKVILWAARGVSCFDLDGHASAVSKVQAVPASRLALSAGYDGMIKMWDTQSRRQLTCFNGCEPIMDFAWEGNTMMSGTRKGYCQVWDLKTGDMVRSLRAHKGHVTCVGKWAPSSGGGRGDVFLSGGQDGVLRVWDCRVGAGAGGGCVHAVECHASPERGTGAVSCLEVGEDYVITGGADRRVCILDPRQSFSLVHGLDHHSDFIYSLHRVGGVVLSGSGKGMMLCHSLVEGTVLYGVGANQGAVRCIASSSGEDGGCSYLLAVGDDGKMIVYDDY